MGARNLLILNNHFGSINIRILNDFVFGNMIWAVGSLWIFFCDYVLFSFGVILKFIFRFYVGERKNDQTPNNFQDSEIDAFKEQVINFLFHSSDDVYEGNEKRDEEEEETKSLAFMERESDFHEVCKNIRETKISATMKNVHEDSNKEEREAEDSAVTEIETATTASKYEFVSGKDISLFIEEPTVMSFSFREFYSNSNFAVISDNFDKQTSQFKSKEEPVHDDEEENCSVNREVDSESSHDSAVSDEVSDAGAIVVEELPELNSGKEHFGEDENCSVNRERSLETDSEILNDSTISHKVSNSGDILEEELPELNFGKEHFVEEENCSVNREHSLETDSEIPNDSAISNEFMDSEVMVEEEFPESNSEKDHFDEEERKESNSKQSKFADHYNSDESCPKSEDFGRNGSSDEDDLVLEEFSSLYDSDSDSVSSSSSGLVWGNSRKFDDLITHEFLEYKNGLEGFETENLKEKGAEDEYIEIEPHMKDLKYNFHGKGESKGEEEENLDELDYDEFDDDLDWEHDDVVEQMKMELKNARQGGLPTILEEEELDEETESPKLVEDLKPLKIEEKMEFRDQMYEIQKVYKSYAEKMRKLDILNYQTMHAIGLLQLKDPLRLISTPKPLISQNLWPRKTAKINSDPLLKFVQELHRDLELVYVGQVCLSWEILCWQHKKAHELKEYDSQGFRQYNIIAGEFQLFQVLMQRFIENEPFQGPRIQNYVKNRCVIRDLLQVPAIRDDCMNEKNANKGEEEDPIASEKLAEIIKESIRVFAEFVRADKDGGNMILKVSQQIRTNFDPAVSDLLIHLRTHQQRKEKRLKDIVRTGNCIVRKFQKQREDQLDHEQLLAQVELKLISRVLNMSKLRKDHIIWCNEKLNRIKFVNKKVQVEPNFLLFPC